MNHYSSTFKDHHFLGIISLVKRIIDNCECAFSPGCEVLYKNNSSQIHIYTNKGGMGEYNSQDFINKNSYLTYKDHHFLGISSLG